MSTPQEDRAPSVRLATLTRGDGSEFRVELSEFKGHRFVNLRQWNKAPDGEFRPDPRRGCSIKLRELEEVATAFGKALELANEGQR